MFIGYSVYLESSQDNIFFNQVDQIFWFPSVQEQKWSANNLLLRDQENVQCVNFHWTIKPVLIPY